MEIPIDTSTPAQGIKYATVRRRFFASIIDSFFLTFLNYILIYPIFGLDLLAILTQNPSTYQQALITNSVRIQFASLLVIFLYQYIFLVHSAGSTIGMKILRIKMLRENDQPIGLAVLVIRSVVSIFSALLFYLGFLWAIFDKKKQTWHDKAAQTVVVESGIPNYLIVLFVVIVSLFLQYGVIAVIGIKAMDSGLKEIDSLQKNEPFKNEWKNTQAKKLYEKSTGIFLQMRKNQDADVDISENLKLNDENISTIKKAIELEPTNPILWYELTNAYTWMSSTHTVEDAIADTKSALELFPQNSYLLENYGVFFVTNKDYENAALQLKKAIRIRPTGRAYEHLGKAYAQLLLYDESIAAYRNAIKEYELLNEDGTYDQTILSIQKSIGAVELVKSGRGTFTN